MTGEELLRRVKSQLSVTGDFHDDALNGYIEEVKAYMLGAGVRQEIVNKTSSVGVISRGVSDLWNYGSGSVGLSPYFKERVIQLTFEEE